MKKEKSFYVKGASSSATPKSSAEATGNSAETAQSLYRKEEHNIWGDYLQTNIQDMRQNM